MSLMVNAPGISIRYPGPRATDRRIAVTLTEPATPFPITVYFLHVWDDERPDAEALINVGFEVGHRFDFTEADGEKVHLERLPRPLGREAVEEVAGRFRQYVEFARAALQLGGKGRGPTPGSKPRGRRREMTDDFLSGIAEQYEAWSAETGRAVTEISRAHGVNMSTAGRWVERARERGFLPGKGE